MARYSHVKGLSVVTMTEGKKVGSVEELLVDADSKSVRWLVLSSGGLFGSQSWLPADAVRGLTEDVVTIGSEGDVRSASDTPSVRELGQAGRKLVGTAVVTQDGRRIGEVSDYDFSIENLAVSEILVPHGKLFSRSEEAIPADKVMTIGKDAIIVANEMLAAEDAPQDQSEAAEK